MSATRPTRNVDLAYNYHFWDGFALPFGIGWSLVLVGIFFAKPLNDMKLLTLPDVFGRRFGPASEVAFGVFAIVSFICLFGSNLVGFGKATSSGSAESSREQPRAGESSRGSRESSTWRSTEIDRDQVIAYVFGLGSPYAGICIAGCTVWVYTVAGGMLSVAYTDIVQGCFGYLGLLVGTAYVYHNFPRAPGRHHLARRVATEVLVTRERRDVPCRCLSRLPARRQERHPRGHE